MAKSNQKQQSRPAMKKEREEKKDNPKLSNRRQTGPSSGSRQS